MALVGGLSGGQEEPGGGKGPCREDASGWSLRSAGESQPAVMGRASQLGSRLEQRCGGGRGSGNFDSASFTQSSRAALTLSFVQSLPFLFPAFWDGLPGGLAVLQPRPWEALGGSEAPD